MENIIIILLGFGLLSYSLNDELEFGKVLGSVDNVIAYSSGKMKLLQYKNNYINNIYTGFKWQCVEYARRYMIICMNLTFENIDNAYEIFNIKYFISLKNNQKIPVQKYINGSPYIPVKNSLLIWKPSSDNINGHVAVIVKVNSDSIEIAEQNYKNIKWKNNYSRKIKLKYNNGYYIDDMNIIGWISQINPLSSH